MDKTTSVLAALDAGKFPTQKQTNQFIDWLLNSALTQIEPIAEGGELSTEGKALVGDIRELLTAYKVAGKNKNRKSSSRSIISGKLTPALWCRRQSDPRGVVASIPG